METQRLIERLGSEKCCPGAFFQARAARGLARGLWDSNAA